MNATMSGWTSFRNIAVALFLVGLVPLSSGCGGGGSAGESEVASTWELISSDTPGSYELSLLYEGRDRTFLLDIPTGYIPGQAAPLIILFHDSGETAESFRAARAELLSLAEAEGIILAFPLGSSLEDGTTTWFNFDEGTVDLPEGAEYQDDRGFVLKMISGLQSGLTIDPTRISIAGFSDGGSMAYYLAARDSGVFSACAAIASAIGAQSEGDDDLLFPPSPEKAIPILIVNGKQDPIRPWSGGVNENGLLNSSVQEAVSFWVEANGCSSKPTLEPLSNGNVLLEKHLGCDGGADVVLAGLEWMGHIWPDSDAGLGWSANLAIVEFFQSGGLDEPVEMTEIKGIAYATHDGFNPNKNSLDMYIPESGDNLPILVYVHGGSWTGGDKSSVHTKQDLFVRSGYLFVSINYRLVHSVEHPDNVLDVANALAWLHDHASEYGGDPESIFVLGHSAGAHLTALVSTDHRRLEAHGKDLSIIKGFITLDTAVYDLPLLMEESDQPIVYLNAFGTDPAVWVDASPITHVEPGKNTPPALLIHVASSLKKETQAELMKTALLDADVAAIVFAAEGKAHGTLNRDLGKLGDVPTREILNFLSALKE